MSKKIKSKTPVSAVDLAAKLLIEIVSNEKVQKKVLGEYTDGDTRTVIDAITGEYLSPKTKKKHDKHKKKKKKHKDRYKLKI